MAKGIANGINELVNQLSAKEGAQIQGQWRSIRNKVDSLLLSTNSMAGRSDEIRKLCLQLDNMTPEEREKHITTYWGANYLARVEPLLHQLKILESYLNSVTPSE